MHAALLFFALTGSAPGYSELPSGHTTVPPESQAPPASIAANEKVPGFFVATPSFPNRRMPKTAKLAKGSGEPNRNKVGKLTEAQVEEIAKQKMPDLNCHTIESAMACIRGTARSMGVEIV